MKEYTATELAYKNGYKDGYEAGVKEFAERLCEGRVSNDPVVIVVNVELKEMLSRKDEGK